MGPTRRRVLLGAGLGLSALSGCTGHVFDSPDLTLNLLNFDSDRHFLDVEILLADVRERSQAVVLQEEFELPPQTDDGSAARRRDVLDSERYVVRTHLNDDRSVRGTYQFYPDCTGNGEPNEELYIEIHRDDEDEEPYISFQQNLCGSDQSWF